MCLLLFLMIVVQIVIISGFVARVGLEKWGSVRISRAWFFPLVVVIFGSMIVSGTNTALISIITYMYCLFSLQIWKIIYILIEESNEDDQ